MDFFAKAKSVIYKFCCLSIFLLFIKIKNIGTAGLPKILDKSSITLFSGFIIRTISEIPNLGFLKYFNAQIK